MMISGTEEGEGEYGAPGGGGGWGGVYTTWRMATEEVRESVSQ